MLGQDKDYYLDVWGVILNDDFPLFYHLVDIFFRDVSIKHIRKEPANVLHRCLAIIPIFIEDWGFSDWFAGYD